MVEATSSSINCKNTIRELETKNIRKNNWFQNNTAILTEDIMCKIEHFEQMLDYTSKIFKWFNRRRGHITKHGQTSTEEKSFDPVKTNDKNLTRGAVLISVRRAQK